MSNTLFFAWQLDTPAAENKSLIWNAIVAATGKMSESTNPIISPRPETDIQGASGNPNIVQTIFKRIRECSIFIADVSFVAETSKGKLLPNPNVLLELGYAARSIGWERTILVMNNAYGKPSDLPFDIRQHRWPIEYKLTSRTQVREKRCEQLQENLIDAISSCQQFILSRAEDMAKGLDAGTLAFVAENEHRDWIEIPSPPINMLGVMKHVQQVPALRHLLDIGAIIATTQPVIGYTWTTDGQYMIKALNKFEPKLLPAFRHLMQTPNDDNAHDN
ncbi:MAG TPA: hypothetical protein P5121_22370 [Caldilineaceae bacterium]|nr:hypothetical protein [Caldilineaceae bacterium]